MPRPWGQGCGFGCSRGRSPSAPQKSTVQTQQFLISALVASLTAREGPGRWWPWPGVPSCLAKGRSPQQHQLSVVCIYGVKIWDQNTVFPLSLLAGNFVWVCKSVRSSCFCRLTARMSWVCWHQGCGTLLSPILFLTLELGAATSHQQPIPRASVQPVLCRFSPVSPARTCQVGWSTGPGVLCSFCDTAVISSAGNAVVRADAVPGASLRLLVPLGSGVQAPLPMAVEGMS